jgi:high-affinity iron transporter
MLATAIIVFREILEAALIIGIVSAATQGVPRRHWWTGAGAVLGVTGAVGVATIADHIVEMADGMGQELFNSLILLTAVLMLAWHNIWMAKHGRELAARIKAVGTAIKENDEPMFALTLVVGLAVLREGSEIVLFLNGLAAGGTTWSVIMSGGLAGLVIGALVGVALYFGLLRIPTRYLFSVTSWMILLLAAGMSAQAAKFLSQADVINFWQNRMWDISNVLPNDSITGSLLHTLIGYDASPTGMQVAFYIMTLLIIGGLMNCVNRANKQNKKTLMNSAIAVCVVVVMGLWQGHAHAGPASTVHTLNIEHGEMEFELNGGVYNDNHKDLSNEQGWELAVGYAFTPWWFSEVEAEWEQEGDHNTTYYGGFALVNIFRFTEQGEYWADFGLFTELEFPDEAEDANKIEIGPMIQKEIGRTVSNLNIIFVRDYGKHAEHDTEFEYEYQTKWLGNKKLEFGLQAFGEFGEVEDTHSFGDQEHKIGPALFGEIAAGGHHKIKYNSALLIGLTDNTPDETLRFTVEYEI